MIEYYEPFFKLNLPTPEIKVDDSDWKKYNPRKDVNRWGVSLTSLDGNTSGVPDLDSLFEYNKLNSTKYCESDFKMPTKYFSSFNFLSDKFDLGRSHVLKLGVGGFFPYHRDFDTKTFRLVYTISGCDPENFIWIQNNNVLRLENQSWYYVNTKMAHSVFSFFGCQFAVFNVIASEKSLASITENASIK
jgi:hypothetical protein